jgi:hypothetical protein
MTELRESNGSDWDFPPGLGIEDVTPMPRSEKEQEHRGNDIYAMSKQVAPATANKSEESLQPAYVRLSSTHSPWSANDTTTCERIDFVGEDKYSSCLDIPSLRMALDMQTDFLSGPFGAKSARKSSAILGQECITFDGQGSFDWSLFSNSFMPIDEKMRIASFCAKSTRRANHISDSLFPVHTISV